MQRGQTAIPFCLVPRCNSVLDFGMTKATRPCWKGFAQILLPAGFFSLLVN